jgi:hypothetical protein
MAGVGSISSGLTGVLPFANGGTNNTNFLIGSIPFSNGTSLTSDTSNLFWDNTNKRLSIGKNNPNAFLSVSAPIGTGINLFEMLDETAPGGFLRIQDFTSVGANFAPGIASKGVGTSGDRTGLLIIGEPGNDNFNSNTAVAINGRLNGAALVTAPVFQVSNFTTLLLRIAASGNVGIGTTSPLSKLNIMGTVRINSASAPDANYYLQLENSASQKAKANAWDTYSDSRIKTNRQPIINAIDKINLLNPTYYNQHDSYVEDDLLNIDYNNSYKSLGFIAQEVYEVIPEAVNMGTTNELWAMDYTKLIPILTKAIQEQQALIKALEQRIINLENK